MKIILPRTDRTKTVTDTETVETVKRYPYQMITSDGTVYSLIPTSNVDMQMSVAVCAACVGVVGWFTIGNTLLAATVAGVAVAVAVGAARCAFRWVENYTPLVHKTVTTNDGRTVATMWI
jgi:hypothetical protein